LGQYIPAAGGMAWLKIYFENKPAQALPWVKALESVPQSTETTELVARLYNWSYMSAGNKDDAKVKLSTVADRDAVAALGMVQLLAQSPENKPATIEMGRKLLAHNPSKLSSALLFEALSPLSIK